MQTGGKAPEPVRPVLSTVVEPMRSSSTVAVGTVEPRFKTDLSFRLLGRLIARPVNVGDLVGQGDVIAAIDSTALEFAVRSAKAELAKSQAQLANTSATEERQRTLITTDTTTKATLDNAVQARAGAEASVARAQANLTKALEQLSYAQLKSDFAGVVTAVGADVGQVVSPGQSIVTVARPDIREAVVDIGPDFPVPLACRLAIYRQPAAPSRRRGRGGNSRDCATGRSCDAHAAHPNCLERSACELPAGSDRQREAEQRRALSFARARLRRADQRR